MVDYIDRRSGEAVEDGVESATIPLRLPGGACHREPARTPPRPRQTRRHTDTTRITPTALKASTGAANDDRPRRPGEPDPRPAGPAPSHSRSNPEPPHSRARRVSASLWAVAALHEALLQYAEEGGLPARHQRYARNCQALLDGMAELGLRSFLPAQIQAPIIVTFHAPHDPRYQFKDFYERVKAKGFILYPGKLTQVDTFRVGCIGHVDAADMHAAVTAIADVLHAMGITLTSSGAHA